MPPTIHSNNVTMWWELSNSTFFILMRKRSSYARIMTDCSSKSSQINIFDRSAACVLGVLFLLILLSIRLNPLPLRSGQLNERFVYVFANAINSKSFYGCQKNTKLLCMQIYHLVHRNDHWKGLQTLSTFPGLDNRERCCWRISWVRNFLWSHFIWAGNQLFALHRAHCERFWPFQQFQMCNLVFVGEPHTSKHTPIKAYRIQLKDEQKVYGWK